MGYEIRSVLKLQSPFKKGTRLVYLDAFHFFAAMLIWFTHYASIYLPSIFIEFEKYPLRIFFYGLTGKLGVAVLCVVLGFLAYRKGGAKGESVIVYGLSRYVYFALAALVYHLLAIIAGLSDFMNGCGNPVKFLIKISATFNEISNGLFWCFLPMLAGSILLFINGRLRARIPELLAQLILLIVLKQYWIAICFLGGILVYIGLGDESYPDGVPSWKRRTDKVLSKWYVLLLLFVAGAALIKREESFLTWCLYGVAAFLWILVAMKGKMVQKVLSCRAFAFLGRTYFGIFLLHPVMYQALAPILRSGFMAGLSDAMFFWLSFLLITVIMIILAFPLQYVIRVGAGMFHLLLTYLSKRISSFAGGKASR